MLKIVHRVELHTPKIVQLLSRQCVYVEDWSSARWRAVCWWNINTQGVVAELFCNGCLVSHGLSRLWNINTQGVRAITIYQHGCKSFNSGVEGVAESLRNVFCNIATAMMGRDSLESPIVAELFLPRGSAIRNASRPCRLIIFGTSASVE